MKIAFRFFVVILVVYLLNYLINHIGDEVKVESLDGLCSFHEGFYKSEFKNGLVLSKYKDSKNHNMETVILNDGLNDFRVLMILNKDLKDFERIKVGDTISKVRNTFVFVGRNSGIIELDYKCKY